jgi:hypothetical protein
MKRLCIITLVILCLGVCQNSYAEIINGYEYELKKNEKYIRNLNEIAKGVLDTLQRGKLNNFIQVAHKNAEKLREDHAKTQELIERFRMIDPDLYDEIANIKDREGNEIDVYIKVVDRLRLGMLGATNVSHHVDNPNVYKSEYGDYTVSVKVVNTTSIRAMLILVHELGHVRYQVPHLADYTVFYKQTYQNKYLEGIKKGHHPDDPGHITIEETLIAFKASWIKYNKEKKRDAKNKSRKTLASTRED